MAKSIRSKVKKANRRELRRTIGTDAERKNMEATQAKLRKCIAKGSMNSFEHLSNMLSPFPKKKEEVVVCEDEDVTMTEKRQDKMPIKAKKNHGKKKCGAKKMENEKKKMKRRTKKHKAYQKHLMSLEVV